MSSGGEGATTHCAGQSPIRACTPCVGTTAIALLGGGLACRRRGHCANWFAPITAVLEADNWAGGGRPGPRPGPCGSYVQRAAWLVPSAEWGVQRRSRTYQAQIGPGPPTCGRATAIATWLVLPRRSPRGEVWLGLGPHVGVLAIALLWREGAPPLFARRSPAAARAGPRMCRGHGGGSSKVIASLGRCRAAKRRAQYRPAERT